MKRSQLTPFFCDIYSKNFFKIDTIITMNNLEKIKNKIYDFKTIVDCSELWKSEDLKLVFTNGCFDILHRGHVEYLSNAKDLGDVLIVGLNTDKSVKMLKGSDRPINDEDSRALILASLSFVDVVVLFDEETPLNLISAIKPDVLVKGGDYKAEEIVGYDIVKDSGGEIVVIDLVDGFSTTNIIKKADI